MEMAWAGQKKTPQVLVSHTVFNITPFKIGQSACQHNVLILTVMLISMLPVQQKLQSAEWEPLSPAIILGSDQILL